MSWILYAFLTVIFYSLFDLFVKLSSGKIHVFLGGFIVNLIATLVLFIFLIISKMNGEKILEYKQDGMIYSILGGVAVGLVTVFFYKMFAGGVNLSVGSPLVRIGVVALAGLLGIIALREAFNLRYILGLGLSFLGMFFLLTSR